MAGLQRAVSAGLVQPTTDNAQKRHVQHSIVPHSRSQRKCSNMGQFSVAFNTPWMRCTASCGRGDAGGTDGGRPAGLGRADQVGFRNLSGSWLDRVLKSLVCSTHPASVGANCNRTEHNAHPKTQVPTQRRQLASRLHAAYQRLPTASVYPLASGIHNLPFPLKEDGVRLFTLIHCVNY